MFSLNFSTPTKGISQIGGGAFIPSIEHWPKDKATGVPLAPFFCIRADLFAIPTLPSNHVVTIFLPSQKDGNITRSLLRKFTCNDASHLSDIKSNPCRVLLHPESNIELFNPEAYVFPPHSVRADKFNDRELEEELLDDKIGLQRSKLYGRPGWIQDELFFPQKFDFCLQIFESDLRKIDREYDGVFGDGAVYLFLDKGIKRKSGVQDVGILVAQFT